MSSLIARLWNGDVDLAKAYWVYSALGGFVLGLVRGLAETAAASHDSVGLGLLFVAATILWYAYVGLMAVAIWRSADTYQGPWLWAGLAKTSVVLGVIVAAGEIIWALGTYSPTPA